MKTSCHSRQWQKYSLSNDTLDLSMKMVPALGCSDGSASQSSGSLSLICCKLPTLSCSLGKSWKCGPSFRPVGGLERAQQLFLLPISIASLVPELRSNTYTWKAPTFRTVKPFGRNAQLDTWQCRRTNFCMDGHFGTWIQHSHIRCYPKHLLYTCIPLKVRRTYFLQDDAQILSTDMSTPIQEKLPTI